MTPQPLHRTTTHRNRVAARRIFLSAFASLLVLAAPDSHGQATKASVVVSPDPGSTFPSSEVTSEWKDVDATGYIFRLGSNKDGLDLYKNVLSIGDSARLTNGAARHLSGSPSFPNHSFINH